MPPCSLKRDQNEFDVHAYWRYIYNRCMKNYLLQCLSVLMIYLIGIGLITFVNLIKSFQFLSNVFVVVVGRIRYTYHVHNTVPEGFVSLYLLHNINTMQSVRTQKNHTSGLYRFHMHHHIIWCMWLVVFDVFQPVLILTF